MNATTKTLRCLIVEDMEDDAQLMLRQLRTGGYDVAWERVDTPEAMRAALARQPWDLVLSDYRMPRFSGLAALAILRASGIDLPFIIVSGTIGEEIAVAAMKAGVDDYLIKGQLEHLTVAVERELRNVETRREGTQATAAITRQLHELQRWHEVMLDREDRVQELKREVNELAGRLGEAARYPSQAAQAEGSVAPNPNPDSRPAGP